MNLVGPDDPILTAIANPVEFPCKDFSRIVASMLRTMITNNGCGLAAPQIGIPLRIITYSYGGKLGSMINPTITYKSPDLDEYTEGCLTYPGKTWKTKRSKNIRISFYNSEKVLCEDVVIDGFIAIILQHEIDHLNGILISQHGFPEKDV